MLFSRFLLNLLSIFFISRIQSSRLQIREFEFQFLSNWLRGGVAGGRKNIDFADIYLIIYLFIHLFIYLFIYLKY